MSSNTQVYTPVYTILFVIDTNYTLKLLDFFTALLSQHQMFTFGCIITKVNLLFIEIFSHLDFS